MQMRPGDPPRLTHVRDELPLLDVHAPVQSGREAREVTVDARDVRLGAISTLLPHGPALPTLVTTPAAVA